jgi:hypothetical protein
MHLTRTISSAARKSLSKPMSSLAPGHILSGARWNYRIKEAVEGDNTQISTGFKAEIIQHESVNRRIRFSLNNVILINAEKGFKTRTM